MSFCLRKRMGFLKRYMYLFFNEKGSYQMTLSISSAMVMHCIGSRSSTSTTRCNINESKPQVGNSEKIGIQTWNRRFQEM